MVSGLFVRDYVDEVWADMGYLSGGRAWTRSRWQDRLQIGLGLWSPTRRLGATAALAEQKAGRHRELGQARREKGGSGW